MASPLGIILESLGERLDEDLLPALYAAASVPTEQIRAWLKEAGHAHLDPATGTFPSAAELDESALAVVRSARDRATLVGLASGFVGPIALPSEVLASVVS